MPAAKFGPWAAGAKPAGQHAQGIEGSGLFFFNSLLFRQFESELREVIYTPTSSTVTIFCLKNYPPVGGMSLQQSSALLRTDSNLTLVFGGQPGLFYPPILVTNVVSHHKFTD